MRQCCKCHEVRDLSLCISSCIIGFIERNFLNQIVRSPTRLSNILDIVLTNSSRDVIEVKATPTPLSDHNLVEIKLGYDLLKGGKKSERSYQKFSFHNLDIHRCEIDKIKAKLGLVNWSEILDICPEDDAGYSLSEIIRLTTLQISCEYSPEKKTHGTKKKNHKRNILYRKKKKLKAKLRRLQVYTPHSPNIQKVQDKLSMVQLNLRDQINSDLEGQEKKAVSTIKENPRYFYSYEKRFSKLKSTIGPLINENDCLKIESQKQSEILQTQYCSSFSDPNSRSIENTPASLPPGLILHSKIGDISFDKKDIIKAIDEIDPYSATSHHNIPVKILKWRKRAQYSTNIVMEEIIC